MMRRKGTRGDDFGVSQLNKMGPSTTTTTVITTTKMRQMQIVAFFDLCCLNASTSVTTTGVTTTDPWYGLEALYVVGTRGRDSGTVVSLLTISQPFVLVGVFLVSLCRVQGGQEGCGCEGCVGLKE